MKTLSEYSWPDSLFWSVFYGLVGLSWLILIASELDGLSSFSTLIDSICVSAAEAELGRFDGDVGVNGAGDDVAHFSCPCACSSGYSVKGVMAVAYPCSGVGILVDLVDSRGGRRGLSTRIGGQ